MSHWLAPAKVNLSLRILGKRSDGFHDLESLMVPLTLVDTLEIERSDAVGVSLRCSDPEIPCDERNLVVQAARVFFEATGRSHGGVRVELKKRIPSGAGLGGGSSDAGAMLRAMNALFETGFSVEELADLGARVGSDVPFFLHEKAAWIRGRGERVEPLECTGTVPKLRLLLIKPPFGVPTPWAYRNWRDSQEIPGIPYGVQYLNWGELVNDLERPVFQKYLLLADLKQWLLKQPEVEGALMSGSGATVFAVLREGLAAEALRERLSSEFGPELWTVFCQTQPNPQLPGAARGALD